MSVRENPDFNLLFQPNETFRFETVGVDLALPERISRGLNEIGIIKCLTG